MITQRRFATVLTISIIMLVVFINIFYIGYNKTLNIKVHNLTQQLEDIKTKNNIINSNLISIINSQSEKIKQLNLEKEEMSKQAAKLENTIKQMSASGKKPQNYKISEQVSRGGFDRYKGKLKYVGEWIGTCYTPCKQECGNNKGITASGNPVTPGKTIAVDTKYWKLGTKFYVEGIGECIGMDCGGGIKGKNRFDWCILDRKMALNLGKFKVKVYLIEEDTN